MIRFFGCLSWSTELRSINQFLRPGCWPFLPGFSSSTHSAVNKCVYLANMLGSDFVVEQCPSGVLATIHRLSSAHWHNGSQFGGSQSLFSLRFGELIFGSTLSFGKHSASSPTLRLSWDWIE